MKPPYFPAREGEPEFIPLFSNTKTSSSHKYFLTWGQQKFYGACCIHSPKWVLKLAFVFQISSKITDYLP
jgi:hypothetical protein